MSQQRDGLDLPQERASQCPPDFPRSRDLYAAAPFESPMNMMDVNEIRRWV